MAGMKGGVSNKRKKKSNEAAQGPEGKRKQKKGVPGVPDLPPDVNEEDVYVSDEDLDFVQKHAQYAGFMANLDTATIDKSLRGSKVSQKSEKQTKQTKQTQDVESQYEERQERIAAKVDENAEAMSVDPVDALPVKSLAGELSYRSTANQVSVEDSKVMNRRALLQQANGTAKETTGRTVEEAPAVVEEQLEEKKPKLTKAERRQLMKEQRKKEKAEKLNGKEEKPAVNGDAEAEEAEEDAQEEEVSYISVQQRRVALKAHMAELGIALRADPEGNLATLKELSEMCLDRDDTIACLALLSSMMVFKDILPGYRIRLPTEKELEMAVSKEVKKLRDFETALLRHYQTYVQTLIKRAAKSKPRRRTALKCMCGLLEAAPHFNYRDSLLKAVVPRMMSYDNDISQMSCDAIKSLFQNEARHGGEATVEAVQLITELVKERRCRVRSSVVEVFLALSFDEDLERSTTTDKLAEKNGTKKSKRVEKKEKREKKRELAAQLRKEVKADFKEASTAPDVVARKKLQTQTLAAIFETYFRVLKVCLEPPDERAIASIIRDVEEGVVSIGLRPLLGPSLDGLSKFSYLINVDFMGDLLVTLGKLAAGGNNAEDVNREDLLTVGERLQCCMIAFKIIRSNLDALTIDLRDFYVQLYNLVFEFNSVRDEEKYSNVLAQALQVMLWENRQHDMQRAAAFLKRLATVSLHLGPAESMAALVTVRFLLQRYKKCRNLLDNDGGGGSIGGNMAIYQADGDDPDVSGALSSVLWEVTLLRQHAHPGVVKLATEISSMSAMTESTLLSSLSPSEAIRLYSTREGGFRPAVQAPPKSVKRKSYKDAGPLSVASLNDLVAVSEGHVNLEDVDNCNSSELEILGRNLAKEFRVQRDHRDNKELRREHKRVLACLELHKVYLSSRSKKPSKSVSRVTKKHKSEK